MIFLRYTQHRQLSRREERQYGSSVFAHLHQWLYRNINLLGNSDQQLWQSLSKRHCERKRSNPEDGSREGRKGYAKNAKFIYSLRTLRKSSRSLREPSSGLLRHDVPRNDDIFYSTKSILNHFI
jgi:hypothetical protein